MGPRTYLSFTNPWVLQGDWDIAYLQIREPVWSMVARPGSTSGLLEFVTMPFKKMHTRAN